jgi:hypothetical protein
LLSLGYLLVRLILGRSKKVKTNPKINFKGN